MQQAEGAQAKENCKLLAKIDIKVCLGKVLTLRTRASENVGNTGYAPSCQNSCLGMWASNHTPLENSNIFEGYCNTIAAIKHFQMGLLSENSKSKVIVGVFLVVAHHDIQEHQAELIYVVESVCVGVGSWREGKG